VPVVRLLDEVPQHLFSNFEIRYHAVFHRLDGHHVPRRPPQHLFCFPAHGITLLITTIDGSFTTMPLPSENTSVFAVPRSMARSDENKLNADLMF
jgi:hypothetical protein